MRVLMKTVAFGEPATTGVFAVCENPFLLFLGDISIDLSPKADSVRRRKIFGEG